MDWQEIMSWYSIDGMILRRALLAKGISQHGLLGTVSDGGMRRYHNPQVPGLRWHSDLGKSIEGMIGRRIVWDPRIKGSIQDHIAWRHGIAHWFVGDPGINVRMLLLWIEVDCLRASNLRAGGFVIFPFLIWSNWARFAHGIYCSIFP